MCPNPVVQVTLVSNSQKSYVVSNTLYGSTVYAVDWDAIFNGLNKKYRKAYVRVHLCGTTNIAKDTISNATGYISLVGLGSPFGYSYDIAGLIIADLQYGTASQISSAETGYYLNSDTRGNIVAPVIYTPQGVMPNFTVQMTQETGAVMANANLSSYAITIMFELFDEIAPQQPSMNMKGTILPMTG
jgi:hypothetical protein